MDDEANEKDWLSRCIPRVSFYRPLESGDALFVNLHWWVRESCESSNIKKGTRKAPQ